MMKKRGLIIILLVLLVMFSTNVIAPPSSGGVNDDVIKTGDPSEQQTSTQEVIDNTRKALADGSSSTGNLPTSETVEDVGEIKKGEISGDVSVSEGALIVEDVKSAETKNGDSIEGGSRVVFRKDGSWEAQSLDYFSSPTMTGTGLSDARFNSDGSYSVGRADSFSHGDVVITSGSNIVFSDGNLVVEKADGTFIGSNWVTAVDMLSLKNKSFSVEKAELVKAGCVVAMDVRDSDFDLSSGVNIVSRSGTSYDLQDCTGNKVSYKSKSGNNEITITQDENKPIYIARDVELKFDKFNETIDTNGTVIIQTDRDFGVEAIIIDEPSASYKVENGDRTLDYSFRAWKEGQTIYIRKDLKQQVDFNCVNCTIVDIPNLQISIKGTIDYRRNLFSGKKILEDDVIVFASNKGNAILSMSRDFKYVEEILIVGDNPPYITRPNNYITIYESPKNGKTHRLIDVNEQLLAQDVAEPIIKKYKTLYSSAIMYYNKKVLHYEKNGFTARILPPGHSEIKKIQNDISGIGSALALSAVGLFFFIPNFRKKKLKNLNKLKKFNKKGQVTIFIILGIILVMFLGLTFFTYADIKKITNRQSFDKTSISDYFNQCYTQIINDGAKLLGAHGSEIDLSVPYFPDLKTKYLKFENKNNVPKIFNQEKQLENYANQKVLNCMIEFKKNWKGINVSRVQAPKSKITIREKDIFGELEWFFTITKGEQWISFNKFVSQNPVDIRYIKILELANITANSQMENDNMFDLDKYSGNNFELVLFPLNQIMNVLIKDYDYTLEYEPYQFVFANK